MDCVVLLLKVYLLLNNTIFSCERRQRLRSGREALTVSIMKTFYLVANQIKMLISLQTSRRCIGFIFLLLKAPGLRTTGAFRQPLIALWISLWPARRRTRARYRHIYVFTPETSYQTRLTWDMNVPERGSQHEHDEVGGRFDLALRLEC